MVFSGLHHVTSALSVFLTNETCHSKQYHIIPVGDFLTVCSLREVFTLKLQHKVSLKKEFSRVSDLQF